MLLAWRAVFADGRCITGNLPDELPGAAVPRDGLREFTLLQGSQDSGWSPVLTVDLADHERLIFRRRMQSIGIGAAAPVAVCLIVGTHDPQAGTSSLLYLNGDGTMTLRAATADVAPEPHEVG